MQYLVLELKETQNSKKQCIVNKVLSCVANERSAVKLTCFFERRIYSTYDDCFGVDSPCLRGRLRPFVCHS